ncbi:uncharacterized protein LOC119350321 [Triticum dicoccoides]|uniref:uncharacterized protein LOC119350321 n=1 Tax=Triticum dicoccoides TaxID=85692 RepID=UPI00188EAAAA|nr:uncharacterized protein LOC119350321 [Triticum dicoccoides]
MAVVAAIGGPLFRLFSRPRAPPSPPGTLTPIPSRPLSLCYSRPMALAVIVAATIVSGVREHVQEVLRGRIRPFRGPAQAGTVRVLGIEPFSAAYITNSSSLPLLRAASDLLTSSTRTRMSEPRSQMPPPVPTTTWRPTI